MTDKVFFVEVPIAGKISTYVRAANEEEAIQKAMNNPDKFGPIKMLSLWELEELEVYKHLVEGNVCHIYDTDATAEESDDFDLEDFE